MCLIGLIRLDCDYYPDLFGCLVVMNVVLRVRIKIKIRDYFTGAFRILNWGI